MVPKTVVCAWSSPLKTRPESARQTTPRLRLCWIQRAGLHEGVVKTWLQSMEQGLPRRFVMEVAAGTSRCARCIG